MKTGKTFCVPRGNFSFTEVCLLSKNAYTRVIVLISFVNYPETLFVSGHMSLYVDLSQKVSGQLIKVF